MKDAILQPPGVVYIQGAEWQSTPTFMVELQPSDQHKLALCQEFPMLSNRNSPDRQTTCFLGRYADALPLGLAECNILSKCPLVSLRIPTCDIRAQFCGAGRGHGSIFQ
jgi:hypothetical protein